MLIIKIVGVNPDNSLRFKVNGRTSSNGNGAAEKNWSVRWKVKRDIFVQSITGIQEKDNSTDIFTHHPPRMHAARLWTATVDANAPDYAVYRYSILWKDSDGNDQTEDPIISINPSTSFFDITKVVLVVAAAALAFLTFQFLRKNKK